MRLSVQTPDHRYVIQGEWTVPGGNAFLADKWIVWAPNEYVAVSAWFQWMSEKHIAFRWGWTINEVPPASD